MSYIKAVAEVIVLDNKDIETAYSDGATQKILDNLLEKNPTAYNRLLGGNNPILHSGMEGLKNLLNDLPEDIASQLADDLNNGEFGVSVETDMLANIEALLNGCLGGFVPNRDKYAADEEDDSFDSEW